MGEVPSKAVPAATLGRLPVYLRVLIGLSDRGIGVVSSDHLAEKAAVRPGTVRRDLWNIGLLGTRGVGYEVPGAISRLTRYLGLTEEWPVAIVGAGNLGRALVSYPGFRARGFPIAAIFDIDSSKVGRSIGRLTVLHIDAIAATVALRPITIGIIATPAEAAQAVTNALVEAGVRSILNFAPAVVTAPPEVSVRAVDLSTELQILAFHARTSSRIQHL